MSRAIVKDRLSLYATHEDFRRVFNEDRGSLHRLSLLLAAEEEIAEQCFEAALEECLAIKFVFRECASSWARRTIITNAIRRADLRKHDHSRNIQTRLGDDDLHPRAYAVCKNILILPDVQRFVLIMSAVEHYSDQECSILLRSSRRNVGEARARTFRQMKETCQVGERECVSILQAWAASDYPLRTREIDIRATADGTAVVDLSFRRRLAIPVPEVTQVLAAFMRAPF